MNRPKREVLIKDDPRLPALWLSGVNSRKIASIIDCAEGYVRRVARDLNLPAKRQNAMGDMFDEWIIKFHNEKMALPMQADKIGVSVDFIKIRRRILGISIPKRRIAP